MAIEGQMTWADVLADKSLQDLPYKIELNGDGKIEMSPAGNRHAIEQARVLAQLAQRTGGIALGECGVQTSNGVRTPDAMWISDARYGTGLPDPLPIAPEICVEIMSPSNTQAEMDMKVRLYLEAGALEVWIVRLDGARHVFRR